MAAIPLTDAQCQEVLDAYHNNGCQKKRAAEFLGIGYRTFIHRFNTALLRVHVAETSVNPPPEIHISVSQRPNPHGRSRLRGIAIGDAHDSPSLADKQRFKWFGRHANKIGADFVIWIGDVFTFDSLSKHDGNDTLTGKFKPSFQQDIDSGHAALSAYDEGKAGHKIKIEHVTLGNHEDRAISFTQRTPEMAGILTGKIDNLLMSHHLNYSQYGMFYYVGDVGFVHAPLNRMGRSYSGVHALNNIANHSLHDIVFGHRHMGGRHKATKLGENQSITILDLGCSLPQGYVEPYVGHASSGWHYGIYELLIDQGRLHSDKHISMTELEELYGD